jgi:hypothetical protein
MKKCRGGCPRSRNMDEEKSIDERLSRKISGESIFCLLNK